MELVYVAIISTIGAIIITQLIQYNYFSKKRFELKLSQVKKLDSIKFAQMKKELNLQNSKVTEYVPEQPNIIDMVKGIDLDKIKTVLGALQETGDEPEGIPGLDGLIGFAQENPEVVGSIINGLKDKNKPQENTIEFE